MFSVGIHCFPQKNVQIFKNSSFFHERKHKKRTLVFWLQQPPKVQNGAHVVRTVSLVRLRQSFTHHTFLLKKKWILLISKAAKSIRKAAKAAEMLFCRLSAAFCRFSADVCRFEINKLFLLNVCSVVKAPCRRAAGFQRRNDQSKFGISIAGHASS